MRHTCDHSVRVLISQTHTLLISRKDCSCARIFGHSTSRLALGNEGVGAASIRSQQRGLREGAELGVELGKDSNQRRPVADHARHGEVRILHANAAREAGGAHGVGEGVVGRDVRREICEVLALVVAGQLDGKALCDAAICHAGHAHSALARARHTLVGGGPPNLCARTSAGGLFPGVVGWGHSPLVSDDGLEVALVVDRGGDREIAVGHLARGRNQALDAAGGALRRAPRARERRQFPQPRTAARASAQRGSAPTARRGATGGPVP